MNISLCMIVKNEEEVLDRCLDSAAPLFDEIVVVDTGSTDGTVEIARRFTENIFYFAWRDDFAAARNHAFSLATGDYICWLDADDVLPSSDLSPVRALLEAEKPDMLMCPYETGALKFYRERFVRREAGFMWRGRVHECIAPRGKILRCDFAVRHLGSGKEKGARNLDIYRKWAGEEALSPRDLFYYGRELFYHKLYTEAIAVLLEMLKGDGWYVNKIEACRVLASCYAAQGKTDEALAALFRSFLYGEPRAGALCDAGSLYMGGGKYAEAAFWYEAALRCRPHAEEGDFEMEEERSLTPLLQLVVCYWRLGRKADALSAHKKTEALAPTHPSVLYNQQFFGP